MEQSREPGGGPTFRFRDIALFAYGPTVVNAVGHGAVMPVLALRARDLGASVGTAALVVALLGVGMMLASLPTGALIARIGERRALLLAGGVDAVAMSAAALTDSVLGLGLAVVLSGASWSAFLIARQGYMIDVVPVTHLARGMATLGGSMRVGVLIGPLLGAGLIHLFGLSAIFVLAAAMSLLSSGIAWAMPDPGRDSRADQRERGHASVWSVLRDNRRHLFTLGVAVIVISASRSVRVSLLPLWADHVGISASTTSLVFAVAAATDIAFFFPGGWLIDKRGRAVVAVPVVLSVAVACLLMPLAWSVAAVTGVAVLMAIGNGLGSGILMTLGADTAPATGRAQYLGGWRLCGDLGNSGAPLLLAACTAIASLPAACLVLGVLGLLGTGWTGYWTRRLDLSRR